MNEMSPKVSVSMITYNHEAYIAQAIESVLMQQCDFPFELVIGEDCSTDRTREIVRDYQEKYPDKIRLLLPETNLGMNRNFVQTMQACHGTYIALLEGDDYWTSPEKLQKQVDYMDGHPESVACFHDAQIVNNIDNSSHLYSVVIIKSIYTLRDLLKSNPIPTCAIMFRNGLIKSFPDWYYDLKMGDWPLHVMHAQYGNLAYINEVMAVYRMHSGGVWSQQTYVIQSQLIVAMLKKLESFLEPEYTPAIKSTVSIMNTEIFCASAASGQTSEAKQYFFTCLYSCILLKPELRGRFGKTALLLYAPKLYYFGQKLKKFGRRTA